MGFANNFLTFSTVKVLCNMVFHTLLLILRFFFFIKYLYTHVVLHSNLIFTTAHFNWKEVPVIEIIIPKLHVHVKPVVQN